MTLTIVVPTLGRPSLANTLGSILAQTVPCEFVIVSDRDRRGTGPTMNRAILACVTDYVGIVGDDDTLDPRYHEWLCDENDDADLFLFRMKYHDGGTLPTTVDPADLHFAGAGGSFVVRTEVARRFPFVTERVDDHFHEDWAMIATVMAQGLKVQISQRVAYYVRH